MNTFDKICAALAFVLGLVLMMLGVFGVFTGCKFNFALPPIVGGLPILFGWGILKPVVVAWKSGHKPPDSQPLGREI